MNSTKLHAFWRRHKKHVSWLALYLATWAVASYIFYLRYPNNFWSPNFFGEDGYIFTRNLIEHGFWRSIFTTFNGYFIAGMYLLFELGRILNWLAFGSQFVNLPRAYAIVSYGYMGFLVTLPLILLRRYLSRPYLLLLVALGCFVPLPGWDYGVIGMLGNTKFTAVYVAFLLILYRLRLTSNSRKTWIVDAALLICGYTNITVYALLPILILPYWHAIKLGWRRPLILIKAHRGLASLITLAILLVPQIIVIKVFGIPKLPGYLDGPFDRSRAIEVLAHRPYLYSIFYGFNKSFNNHVVLASLAVFAVAIYQLRNRRTILPIGIGLYAIFITTVLFVLNRPGVSAFFSGYKSGGPAQFFFTQNLIFYVVFVILLATFIGKWRSVIVKGVFFTTAAIFVLAQAGQAGSYGRNDFMHHTVGTVYSQARLACADRGKQITLTIYPSLDQKFKGLPRSLVCTPALATYQADELNLGLIPAEGQYLGLGSDPTDRFTQTFRSSQPQLDGISLLIGTFGVRITSPYELRLFDSSCTKELRHVAIAHSALADNQFVPVHFDPIKNSANSIYCFSVATTANTVVTPIAVWMSVAGTYSDGQTTIDGTPTESDIVFRPLFRDRVK